MKQNSQLRNEPAVLLVVAWMFTLRHDGGDGRHRGVRHDGRHGHRDVHGVRHRGAHLRWKQLLRLRWD